MNILEEQRNVRSKLVNTGHKIPLSH